MTRKIVIAAMSATLLGSTFLSAPAVAQDASASANANASAQLTFDVAQNSHLDVIAQLEAVGYTILDTKTTLLGRIHIYAQNNVHVREVVVSRWTGEVKYDLIVETFADAETSNGATAGGEQTAEAEGETENENSTSVSGSASSSTSISIGSNSKDDEKDKGGSSASSSGSVSIGVDLN
ncbi:hypothetical protein [Maritalea porphyrae]|uniref:PepSY domain-containing protein n=1 Tax=Maritalea porphyrae TaxID=880732 RepID=A0ABQ5UKU9_9HYPH|nr:hypothetical protein [Maritalea porphyrae]GLQ15859.1 hypothetical protein GCM10007879_01080 [Maritalea porphyrae]